MQKKLIAVAVAGALGAPALAFAQASSVQVFGTLYGEIARIDQGAGSAGNRQDVNLFQNPGSEIGFKGEEQLGGGMSAWFQCASTADFRAQSAEGFCSRNSALGLKGAFGNVFVGNWDTPFKRVGAVNRIVNETGAFGASFLLTGGASTFLGAANRASFARRQNNSVNYDSPNFKGFQFMFATNTDNTATALTQGAANAKPRVTSLGATYNMGPMNFGAAYEKHSNFGTAGTAPSLDDKGWLLSAGYTVGPVRLGAIYTQQKFQTTASAESKVKVWHLAADWQIAGPHGLRAGYTRAGDVTGTAGSASVAGSSAVRPAVGSSTGAKLWQISYVNTLSKRTEATIGYAKLDNDSNAQYALGGTYSTSSLPTAGNNSSVWGLGLRHRF